MNTEPVAQLALKLWKALHTRDWELVRALMHPDADLQAGVAADQLLSRDFAVAATEVAVAAEVYEPKMTSFDALDAHTALVGGKTIHRRPSGRVEERQTVWLFTFENDLLLRSRLYVSIEEALAQHTALSTG
jgi:hypothetical protein